MRDSLTAAALERLFGLGADVLTVEFEALTGEPERVLDALARLCRAVPFGRVHAAPVLPAQRARSNMTALAFRKEG